MKPQEARDMTPDELLTRERELVDELFHLRLRRATSQLPNPMKVRETRRNLARIKTALRERAGLAAATAKAAKSAEAGPEGPSRPTGSGGIGSAQRAKRASTGRAPRTNRKNK
jgi:large subunit ribosomal protein L29